MDLSVAVVQRALVGRYVIERKLGYGGMAIVFLGRHEATQQTVAIKVLRPDFAATVGDRFDREIAILTELVHPNIVPILESGEARGLVYYVMAYAGGGTLAERLAASGPLPLDTIIRVARDIAAALDYAHARNVLHRDIKPDNIMFEDDGRTLLCDFGVARAIERAAGDRISSSGLVVGTPAYMSPEQASGAAELDARSDIYSLGCVVYEMLVGQPPFTGRTAQTIMARHAREPAPRVRVLRPELPPCVEAALLGALAKQPEERPASAGRFVAELVGS